MKINQILAGGALMLSLLFVGCSAHGASSDGLKKIDMTKWQYNEDADVYYQLGIPYVANPADADYEQLALFVPGAYFDGTKNADGTYTVTVSGSGTAGGYTARTAPLVMPIQTPGYAAFAPAKEYSDTAKDFTDAGFIVLWAGARGRDHGAPAGITDFKAAVRYVRWNKGLLPGDTERIFTFGMSGGGAQSALMGATGNSGLYEAYLKQIGAVMTESDAVMGSMDWCPITNLDTADEAYEWNMGMTRGGLDEATQTLSDNLASEFALYVNRLGLKDADGRTLLLEKDAEGRYHAGSYYEYMKALVEDSLNKFLSDTHFPYVSGEHESEVHLGMFGSMMMGMGGGRGPGGNGAGRMPPAGDRMEGGAPGFEQLDNVRRTEAGGGVTISGTYSTVEDYIAALNADGVWVSYDRQTNTARITSLSDFARAVKPATKSVGAFDDLNATQGENTLFGYGDGNGAHFDPVLARLLAGTEYEAAFSADLAKKDSLGNTVDVRVDMYNPMYYLCAYYKGYKSSEVAKFWRIRSGIFQGDTSITTEANLALALQNYGVQDVDFEAVWGLKHVEAERTGSSTANFISWVNDCLK